MLTWFKQYFVFSFQDHIMYEYKVEMVYGCNLKLSVL